MLMTVIIILEYNVYRYIFNSCGLSNLWQNQGQNVNAKLISCIIRQNLQDQFIQQRYNDVNNSSKGQVYRIFKRSFGMENYLKVLSPVETGRLQGKPLGERFCTLFNNCQIGDEFHYILECDNIQKIRKYFLCNYYFQRPNVIKFTELMSFQNETILKKICMFIVKIYNAVCPP